MTDRRRPHSFRVRMLLGALLWMGRAVGAAPDSVEHRGISNASAAVPVGDRWFVAASDEANRLLVYRVDAPGDAEASLDLSPTVLPGDEPPELDLEGGARIGDVAYWIGSHARNKDGKKRPYRRQLLATRLVEDAGAVRLERWGGSYTGLLDDLGAIPAYAALGLASAARQSPEDGGLDIEGLSAGPGGALWIGFRSPLFEDDRALLVSLLNPSEVINGGRARFGDPVLLDLDGRGVRDLAWSGREYFLVAGNPSKGGKSRLYRWAGPGSDPVRVPDTGFKHFNPEGLAIYGTPEAPRLLVVSDDGNRVERIGGAARFRSFWVTP